MGQKRERASPVGPPQGAVHDSLPKTYSPRGEPLEASHLLMPRQAVRPVAMSKLLRLALRRVQEG